MRIAVIGSGITGLGAAWLLAKSHEVTVFEENAHFGGHANTVDVEEPAGPLAVDTGFIVYNTACYPNLIALFDKLDVPTAPTEMSFAVSLGDGAFEYSGNGLSGLFGQPSNLLSPTHWRMTFDIIRFFKAASALDLASHDPDETLGQWLDQNGYSSAFTKRHILPMAAAIWSAPADRMLEFPIAAFARFFGNHGLLQVADRPAWRTVRGGSREYVSRIRNDCQAAFRGDDAVTAIRRVKAGVEVKTAAGHVECFDQAVIATHADTALGLIKDPDDVERNLLQPFRYEQNRAVLHTDDALMPRRKRLWTSWNYLSDDDAGGSLAVTYWMNKLQPLPTTTDYFVTLNPRRPIQEKKVLRSITYQHPLFDTLAMNAQKDLWELQGQNGLWFAGSYFGYGFHEDGLQAGLAVAEDLGGIPRPWSVADARARVLATGAHQSANTASGSAVMEAAE
ncbi:MAG: FAD-dependent oxidoreductase [Pseudomonadota bacterium]